MTNINLANSSINYLDCSGNQLEELSIPKTIKELYASKNNLSSINNLSTGFDFSGFDNLIILDCSDNNINKLNLADCKLLQILKISIK